MTGGRRLRRAILSTLFLLALAGATAAAGGPAARGAIAFDELPLNLALTQVRGNGRRVFATFEDPYCTYCRELAKETAEMNDVTIHTFLYPVLTPDSLPRAQAIWCAPDRVAAWNNWMLNGVAPPAARCDNAAIDRLLALGRKLRVRATPTLFLADGTRLTGTLSKMELEIAISSPRAMSSAAGTGTRRASALR